MKSEMDLINQVEAYFSGKLSSEEARAFDQLRQNNPSVDHQVVAHQNFMNQLSEYGRRHNLMADMEDIHSQLNVAAITDQVLPRSVRVKKMWAKHRFNLAIAASVAILAVLSTLLSTGYLTKDIATNSDYNALRREISRVKTMATQSAINTGSHNQGGHLLNEGEFGGTGFALTTNGYIVTSSHVIKDADSVYIQNTDGESFKVKTVYTDEVNDIAILFITDPAFKSFNSLPYTIKKSPSDVGEEVYTLGFPKDEPVYGKGYLSSSTGYSGDTTAYQVSIAVNNGNSGGPLLDNRGNLIGIIKGKQIKTDGASFAIKSNFLLKAIEAVSRDSSADKLVLGKKNSLAGLSRPDQIRKMENYIFLVKAY